MKPVLLLATFIMATTASATDMAKLREQFNKSKAAWAAFKKQCGDSYVYQVTFSSWNGYGETTTLTVKKGKVAGRVLKVWSGENKGWTESAGQIGNHDGGAPAKTIDQLYDEIDKILKKPPKGVEMKWITDFDKRGIIKTFGCVDTAIADDSPFHGASIQGLKALK
jgi:hypothetical protein